MIVRGAPLTCQSLSCAKGLIAPQGCCALLQTQGRHHRNFSSSPDPPACCPSLTHGGRQHFSFSWGQPAWLRTCQVTGQGQTTGGTTFFCVQKYQKYRCFTWNLKREDFPHTNTPWSLTTLLKHCFYSFILHTQHQASSVILCKSRIS